MILYKYTADCSKLNLEQEDSTKEDMSVSIPDGVMLRNGTASFTLPTVQKRSFSL